MQGIRLLLLLFSAAVVIEGYLDDTFPPEGCSCKPHFFCSDGALKTAVGKLISFVFQADFCRNTYNACCFNDTVIENKSSIRKMEIETETKLGCGYRNFGGRGIEPFIPVNGTTQFGEFPWMVAVFHEELINSVLTKVYIGGGSLINPRVVLTAAHITGGYSARHVHIRAGEWDTMSTTEPLPHQDRRVAAILRNPDFAKSVAFNDYALMILEIPIDIQPHINTICLPEPTDTFDSSNCISTGWGMDKQASGMYQAILKSVRLPVVPNLACQNMLRKTALGPRFILNPSFMCAGGEENVDICMGDGGGPLICPLKSDPTRYVQSGIASWGIGCGKAGNPGVYANVARGRAWIDRTLRKYGLDSTYYDP